MTEQKQNEACCEVLGWERAMVGACGRYTAVMVIAGKHLPLFTRDGNMARLLRAAEIDQQRVALEASE